MLKGVKGTPWVLLVAFLIATSSLQGANRILIKAVASEQYVKDRALNHKKKVQTYNFYEGRYFSGNSKDRGMEEFTFMDIIENMAVNLQRQGYYNNPRIGEGDLLIVVHYGVTNYEESFFDMMGYTSMEDLGYSDNMDASALADFQFNISIADSMNSANNQSRYGKAQLLGMEEAYSTRISPSEEYELKSLLQDARYFVILMAYDLPLIMQGEIKLLWSTRYSIRSAGQSFSQAIKDMNLVAGDFYGKNLKGLNKRRATDKFHVEFGEIEVIGLEQK